MDALYRGIEASLLALCLALGIGVATMSSLPSHSRAATTMSTTLPMISVTAGEPAE